MATVADLGKALVRMGTGSADREAFSGVVNFMDARWDIPIVFVVGYLIMVYAARDKIRPHGFGGVVDASFAVWNLGLSLFSCWGFWNMIWALGEATSERGLHFTICADSSSFLAFLGERRQTMLALCLFCLSKIPEHRVLDLEAQAREVLAVVPPRHGDALLLARAVHGVHAWPVVRRDELLCALGHVHVLLPDDLQVQALAEGLEADRPFHHGHPDHANGLGPRRERHRCGHLLLHGQLSDQGCHGLRRRGDVCLVLLALLAALPRVPEGGRQERPASGCRTERLSCHL